ncbi:ElyC/SanA/YdcF family protein [Symbiopectobacterium sp.]|uniref:ElyC/SanA/YdcF family protein n=1 Tax=Symbiopectobacterium sp. TaxID=2952789 RepID=UPI003F685588
MRLYHANPGEKLIFTGAAAQGNPMTSAQTAALIAESLGIPREDIITLDTPRDTEEEAAGTAALIGQQPFLLVTSASHLPRAASYTSLRQLVGHYQRAQSVGKIFPSAFYLSHSERAMVL